MRGASPRGIRSNRLWSGCFPRQPHNTAFLHPALSSWCSPTERCLLEEMGSFSPYIWFTQTAVVPKHLFCTYLLAAFPLKAGKYFFLTISFSSLSVHVGKMDLFITGYSSDAF